MESTDTRIKEAQAMKWIPGFEEMYKITPNGEVYSYHKEEVKQLTSFKQAIDYWCVNLSKNGSSSLYLIHHLVMQTYGPPKPLPQSEYVITHLDRNKDNNNISNLAWINKSNVRTKPPTPIKAISADDGDIIFFRTLTGCARHFRSNQSILRRVINNNEIYRGYKFEEVKR